MGHDTSVAVPLNDMIIMTFLYKIPHTIGRLCLWDPCATAVLARPLAFCLNFESRYRAIIHHKDSERHMLLINHPHPEQTFKDEVARPLCSTRHDDGTFHIYNIIRAKLSRQ